MKKYIKWGLAISLFWAVSFTAPFSNDSITFQGYLTDSSGAPVFGARRMGFRVYGSATGEDMLISDIIDRDVVVYNGNYATKIKFSDEDLDKLNAVEDAWIQVWVGMKDGTDLITETKRMNPRIQLTAVPYALSVRGIYYDNTNKAVKIGSRGGYGAATLNASTAKDGMIIEGNVGIGTNDPGSYKFAVLGATSLNGTLVVSGLTTLKSDLIVVGDITADQVWHGVWNDLAEFRSVANGEKIIPGKAYVITKDGLKMSSKRAELGTVGVCSDSFGIALGGKKGEKGKAPIAISGWVLAYVDKEYPIGTALTSGPKGILTAMTKKEKREYPERIVGIVDVKPEKYNNIKVDGRYWVKVK